MIPFMILFVVSLMAITDFLYFKNSMVTGSIRNQSYMTGSIINKGYITAVAVQFRTFMFADFGDEIEEYDSLEMLVFMVFTLMLLIVLMNLLIAIIGDSHDSIYANLQQL